MSIRGTFPRLWAFGAAFAVLFCLHGLARAQLQVEIEIKRNLFIRYEPILSVVTIRNLSGREMRLADQGEREWFGFSVEMQDGRPVLPRSSGGAKEPVTIGPGEQIRRQINLTPLFGLDDFGRYRVRAVVFDASSQRYFTSQPATFEMTDGRLLWQQTVGHPTEGGPRQISLLTHRLPSSTSLYLRIGNPDAGQIYCTHRLGPLLVYGPPDIEIDRNNQIHVLHLNAPRSFIYSHIGLNGEILERKAFRETRNRPRLVKDPGGLVAVQGGTPFDPSAKKAAEEAPSISDRPVPLPPPDMSPNIRKARPSASPDSEPGGGFNIWPFRKKSE